MKKTKVGVSHYPYLKAAPSLQNFDSIETLAKGFVDLKTMQGASISIPSESASEEAQADFRAKLKERVPDLLQLPAEDADDEVWSDVYKALGAPEEYKLPESLEGREDLITIAKSANMTKRQFNALVKRAEEATNDSQTQAQADKAALEAAVHGKWGAAKDDKIKAAAQAAAKLGAPAELVDAVTGGTASLEVLQFLDNIATAIGSEGNELSDQQGANRSARLTPELAKAEIADILDNKAYWEPQNPRQPILQKRMIELQKMVLA